MKKRMVIIFIMMVIIIAKLWDDTDYEFWIMAILNGYYLSKAFKK